jgi:predicted dehydrogenase
MKKHPEIKVLCIARSQDVFLEPLIGYLKTIPRLRLKTASVVPDLINGFDIIVTTDPSASLRDFVQTGGSLIAFFNTKTVKIPRFLGVEPLNIGPSCEIRLLFENRENPLGRRLPDAFYVKGNGWKLNKTSEAAETILYADWRYTHIPMLTCSAVGDGLCAASVLTDLDHPVLLQIFYRLIIRLTGNFPTENPVGVGLLGYPASVGCLHGTGTETTHGLRLAAVCDINPERRQAAREDFPDVRIYESIEELAEDSDVSAAIVSTPPNTHADLCISMLREGKHVICEKPLAITPKEADSLAEASERYGVHLGCHQNRRFDSDYLTIRRLLEKGAIGELFHLETFVGGFYHPCGYWHSHEPVSGGTAYDWGAHYLDWIVSLIPEKVRAVSGLGHKRVWHDVTNSDQESIRIRFAGNQEAEFIHSDIAAFRKPKWYLLGTRGAIVGMWKDVTEFTIDPILYYRRHDIPATEMPPDIRVRKWTGEGRIIEEKPPLIEHPPFAFHRNLADHLILGEPSAAPLSDSIRVVKILDAAARSSKAGGAEVLLND